MCAFVTGAAVLVYKYTVRAPLLRAIWHAGGLFSPPSKKSGGMCTLSGGPAAPAPPDRANNGLVGVSHPLVGRATFLPNAGGFPIGRSRLLIGASLRHSMYILSGGPAAPAPPDRANNGAGF